MVNVIMRFTVLQPRGPEAVWVKVPVGGEGALGWGVEEVGQMRAGSEPRLVVTSPLPIWKEWSGSHRRCDHRPGVRAAVRGLPSSRRVSLSV